MSDGTRDAWSHSDFVLAASVEPASCYKDPRDPSEQGELLRLEHESESNEQLDDLVLLQITRANDHTGAGEAEAEHDDVSENGPVYFDQRIRLTQECIRRGTADRYSLLD